MTKIRHLLLLALVVASVCVSNVAVSADINMNMGAGAKVAWDNYRHAVLDYTVVNMDENSGEGGYTVNDYPGPRFGGNFQLVFNRRIVGMVNLDFSTTKHTVWTYPDGTNPADTQKLTQKFFRLGVGLEGKFYITEPKDMKAAPYVFLGFGKYFAKTDTPYGEGDLASSKMMSKLASPFYLSLGFGAEFFVNESFSLGADIFGFRLETAKGETDEGANYDNDYYTGDQKIINFYMYTALTFNFTFLKNKSKKTETKPKSSDVWGTGYSNSNDWGTPAPAPANNSWGTPASPAQSSVPAGNNGQIAPPATSSPQPNPVTPESPAPQKQEAQPKAKKKKKASVSGSVGGAVAPPPPAP